MGQGSWTTERVEGRLSEVRLGLGERGGATRWAIAAASILFDTFSFRRMWETWTLAALVLMTSAEAISRFVWPHATRLEDLGLAWCQSESVLEMAWWL